VIQDLCEGFGFDLEEAFIGVVEEIDEHQVADDDDGEEQYFDEVGPGVGGFEKDGEENEDEAACEEDLPHKGWEGGFDVGDADDAGFAELIDAGDHRRIPDLLVFGHGVDRVDHIPDLVVFFLCMAAGTVVLHCGKFVGDHGVDIVDHRSADLLTGGGVGKGVAGAVKVKYFG